MSNQTNYSCPFCSLKFPSSLLFLRHCKNVHGKSSEDVCIHLSHAGKRPVCKCGCGEEVTFVCFSEGFREFIRGHQSRVHNNWGHNAKAQAKSREKIKAMRENGEIPTWCKGLTKETDERLRLSGLKGSATSKANPEVSRSRSERMKEHWKSGVIQPLSGPNHSQWKGGVSPLSAVCHSNRKLYLEWKFPILKASEFRCSVCSETKTLEVHHDEERFAEILHKVAAANGWTENISTKPVEDLAELKAKISEAVADYHIDNKVSGVVLCKDCHKALHESHNL